MTDPANLSPAARLADAFRQFDAANALDPNEELCAGVLRPRELVYAEWLTAWVMRLAPDASEALRLAARCQHLRRWEIPREQYPMDRPGYLRWRADLKQFHARAAGEILGKLGFPEELIGRVRSLNLKQNFPQDPDARVLEDALCLVFLEHQLPGLARKTTPEKLLNALRKSWGKMTPAARELALALPYAPAEKALLTQALAG